MTGRDDRDIQRFLHHPLLLLSGVMVLPVSKRPDFSPQSCALKQGSHPHPAADAHCDDEALEAPAPGLD